NSLELEYRSERAGLTPMLFGLIKGLGKRFGLNCRIKQLVEKGPDSDCHVFLIEWE
ncbi:MAG: hem-NO-binding, partial [Bacteroidota bacterium]